MYGCYTQLQTAYHVPQRAINNLPAANYNLLVPTIASVSLLQARKKSFPSALQTLSAWVQGAAIEVFHTSFKKKKTAAIIAYARTHRRGKLRACANCGCGPNEASDVRDRHVDTAAVS